MTSLAGAPEAIASADASMWKRNGTGSSSYSRKKQKKKGGDHAAGTSYGKDAPVVQVCLREIPKHPW